jgi:hypothetical protein
MTASITGEQEDNTELGLTDEQLAEVRRRRAKPNPNYVPIAEARKRFRMPPTSNHPNSPAK